MLNNIGKLGGFILLAVVVAGGILLSPAHAQTVAPAGKPAAAAAYQYRPSFPRRAQMFYGGAWGIDSLHVKAAESGELIRFSWRVSDPDKAAALNDKKIQPSLIDPQARVSLVVPEMEKVGALRQSSTPEAGKSYWMAFSNPGRRVKRGDRVTVIIGQFRAVGLVVE